MRWATGPIGRASLANAGVATASGSTELADFRAQRLIGATNAGACRSREADHFRGSERRDASPVNGVRCDAGQLRHPPQVVGLFDVAELFSTPAP